MGGRFYIFYCLSTSVPLSRCSLTSIFLPSHEYWTNFDEIWGRWSLPPIDKLIKFWANLRQRQGSKVQQKIRIDVKPVLSHSEFTVHTKADATADIISISFFLPFFFLFWGGTRSLRMPALRPVSQAGPMRNPREGTSVVLRDTIRLTWWCL